MFKTHTDYTHNYSSDCAEGPLLGLAWSLQASTARCVLQSIVTPSNPTAGSLVEETSKSQCLRLHVLNFSCSCFGPSGVHIVIPAWYPLRKMQQPPAQGRQSVSPTRAWAALLFCCQPCLLSCAFPSDGDSAKTLAECRGLIGRDFGSAHFPPILARKSFRARMWGLFFTLSATLGSRFLLRFALARPLPQ